MPLSAHRFLFFGGLAVVCGASSCQALSSVQSKQHDSPSFLKQSEPIVGAAQLSNNRRALFGAISAAALPVFWSNEPAAALQARNEALCGTGFFTNIAQYKCTEIGDISDEGKTRPLSKADEGITKSLMGKIGMENVEISDEGDKSKDEASKRSSKSKPVESTKL